MAGYTFWLRMKRVRTKTRGGRIKQSGKEKEISGVRVNLRDCEQDFGDRVSESTVTAVGDIEERLRDFIGESDGEFLWLVLNILIQVFIVFKEAWQQNLGKTLALTYRQLYNRWLLF